MTTHDPDPRLESAICSASSDRLPLSDPAHPPLTIPAAGTPEPLLDHFLALLAGIAWRLACEPSTDVQSVASKQAA